MFKTISKGAALFAAVFALTACDNGNSQPQQGKQYEVLPVSLAEYNLAPVTEVFSELWSLPYHGTICAKNRIFDRTKSRENARNLQ